MKTNSKPFLITLLSACAVLASVGCDVTESDVTEARQRVAEEQRETTEARIEGQENVREKQQQLAEARHSANRPNYDIEAQENVSEAQQEVAEAKREAAENMNEEQRETEEAKAEADKMAQKLAATKARDAYVADLKSTLETYNKKIEAKQDSTENLEGAELQAAETEIEVMEVNRENLSDAISEIESADVMSWESEKARAEQALERINRDSK